MLHTKIVDSKKEKILTSSAEKFIKEEYQKEAKKKKSLHLIVQNHMGVNFIWIFQD